MTESGVQPTPAEPLFDAREMTQLRRDDGDASRVIGTMLTAFFFYSLLVVIGVSGFTAWAMTYQRQRFNEPAAAADGHASGHADGHAAGHSAGHAADHKHDGDKGHDEKGHDDNKPTVH